MDFSGSIMLYSPQNVGSENPDASLLNTTLPSLTGSSDYSEFIWNNTTCPDGTNSDDDDGDQFTCLYNLEF